MKQNSTKGFTLIELLVVIAIIGILSSVVLASLSTARGRGNDSAIKQNLVSLRTQAELVYADSFNFNAVCGHNNVSQNNIIAQALAEVNRLNGGSGYTCAVPATAGNANAWAIAADLANDKAFCIDSSGRGREINAAGTAYTGATSGAAPALSGPNDLECN